MSDLNSLVASLNALSDDLESILKDTGDTAAGTKTVNSVVSSWLEANKAQLQGEKGVTGIEGERGPYGADGPQGSPGRRGEPGSKGPSGVAHRGPRGPRGSSNADRVMVSVDSTITTPVIERVPGPTFYIPGDNYCGTLFGTSDGNDHKIKLPNWELAPKTFNFVAAAKPAVPSVANSASVFTHYAGQHMGFNPHTNKLVLGANVTSTNIIMTIATLSNGQVTIANETRPKITPELGQVIDVKAIPHAPAYLNVYKDEYRPELYHFRNGGWHEVTETYGIVKGLIPLDADGNYQVIDEATGISKRTLDVNGTVARHSTNMSFIDTESIGTCAWGIINEHSFLACPGGANLKFHIVDYTKTESTVLTAPEFAFGEGIEFLQIVSEAAAIAMDYTGKVYKIDLTAKTVTLIHTCTSVIEPVAISYNTTAKVFEVYGTEGYLQASYDVTTSATIATMTESEYGADWDGANTNMVIVNGDAVYMAQADHNGSSRVCKVTHN